MSRRRKRTGHVRSVRIVIERSKVQALELFEARYLQIIQVTDDHFSLETYAGLRIPHLNKNSPCFG